MVTEVKVPPAGESITTASIAQWHQADGDEVKRGDLLATIETDKVSNELEAEVDGTLKIVVAEGEDVGIGTVIATIDGGSGDGATASVEAPASEAPAEVAPAPTAGADGAGEPKVHDIKVPAAGDSITTASIAEWHKRDREAVRKGETLVTLETDKVSNELEAEMDGVLTILSPEGEEVGIGAVIGRIVSGAASPVPAPADDPAPVEEARSTTPEAEETGGESGPGQAESPERIAPDLSVVAETPKEADAPPPPAESDGRVTRKRMSMMRRKIATQLVNVQQTAAILTTFNEADMTAVMTLRKQVQEDFVAKYGVKLGFMSFFVKAVVQALRDVPALNSRIDGNELVENHFYDIGVAVGTEKGLVVPVLRDAGQMSFSEIEQGIMDYALRARDGKIQIADMQGGSFTISNGGVYGSLLSTPIINPPQSGILGMHTIQQRPVAVDGRVEIRPMMYLALSYDHRIVDGKGAVTFLIRIKEAIENPTRLMLEL